MKRNLRTFVLVASIPFFAFSQTTFTVKGNAIDNRSRNPLEGVLIRINGVELQQQTAADGTFVFPGIPPGNYILYFEKSGYISMDFPLVVEADLDMDVIPMEKDIVREQTDNVIVLTENELDNDEGSIDVVSGVLHASRDAFSRVAAFEFSQTFFRPRGLGAEDGVVLINGIAMNKLFNGRPQWSNWGGLNDVTRNQDLTSWSEPSEYSFGGLSGATHIATRASGYRPGFRLSAAASNRSYTGRLMATYSSGLKNNIYAYTVSTSRRWASEGFTDGTMYHAPSFFGAFEYRLHPEHSINLTAIYAVNQRGKSSPNTQEVYDLKGIRYNAYWGYQNGKIRNSRMRHIEEPMVILSHYWNMPDQSKLNINIAYQTGKTGNSRLDYNGATAITTASGEVYYSGGAPNPDPTYYQKLPGFLLAHNDGVDYEAVHRRREAFLHDGQIDWNAIYAANLINATQGRNAAYVLYEDRNDDDQWTANAIFNTRLSEHIDLDAAVNYRKLRSENFALVSDLLGGTAYLDVDSFADPARAPNDLQQPGRIAGEGDRFKYHYRLYAGLADAFVQAKFSDNTFDLYLSGTVGTTTYQREGLYQNGLFPDSSLGKGPKVNFTTMGLKAGLTYKINGKHFIALHTAYLQNAPVLRNTFSNARQNHNIVNNITTKKTQAIDLSYIVRTSRIQSRLTGYYRGTTDATNISFFFVDGLNGDTSSFVQEVLTGIAQQNIGVEFGLEAHVTPSIKLKGAAAVGEFIYSNNPDLYLTSDDLEESLLLRSELKNYKVPGGPQRAFSLGFEYRDPEFWWFGASLNYFSNAYIGINPLRRTSNFYVDAYGLPFPEYDEATAKRLLRQEKIEDYMLLNLVGGKSWRIKRTYYIGLFAGISNALNRQFVTGGFEQARNGNYRELLEDHQNKIPVFGPKYWYGRGANYFINLSLSF